MPRKTRFGLEGFGVRPAGSFNRTGGPHPVARLTRLSVDGYGARRAGSFDGRGGAGAHPVGVLTRLGADGYGAKRAGSFSGKTASSVTVKSRRQFGSRIGSRQVI